MIRNPTFGDNLLLIAAVLMFSQSFVSVRYVVTEFDTVWIVAFRILGALAVLLPWTMWRGIVLPKTAKSWALLATLSGLNIVLPFFLFTWAMQYVGAGEAALIFGSIPLFGLVISHFSTADDRFTMNKFAGVVLGFVGIATLFGFNALSGDINNLLAYGALFGAALCYALSGGLIRHLVELPPVRMTFLIYLMALPVFVIIAPVFGGPLPASPSPANIGHILFLGIFPSGLGYLLRFKLIPAIGYSYFSLFMNLIPVFGVILGAVVLREPVSMPMLVALVLILGGLGIARVGKTDPTA